MEIAVEQLRMYGQLSGAGPLAWSWVEAQLVEAGTYWVVPRGAGHPHPRPVWGVWRHPTLHLSIGSLVVTRQLAEDARVTVHLGSGTDVVIVEGVVAGRGSAADVLERYDAKYDWEYSVDEYGPLTSITASTVLAWRSAGSAGRDGFQESGRWRVTS